MTQAIYSWNSRKIDYEQLCFEDPFLIFDKDGYGYVSMVDIVDSTCITAKMTSEQAQKYYMVFINSLSRIAQYSGAKIVKNIGDSILFYFPKSDYRDITDYALLCAHKMISEIPNVNLFLKRIGLPKLSYRVSIDYGKIIIAKCKISSNEDIFGSTVNLCAKMNKYAKPGSIIIGNDLYQIAKKDRSWKMEQISHINIGLRQKYPVYQAEKTSSKKD